MSKKKKGEAHEAEENEERWLLTYSDMITLLLALFIILYSMSTVDSKKFAEIAEKFGALLSNPAARVTLSQSDGNGYGVGTSGLEEALNTIGASGGSGTGMQLDALDEVYNILQKYIEENNLESQIDLENTSTYVKIHLKDSLMFKPDSDNLLASSDPVLKEIYTALSQVYSRIDYITISGHTADIKANSIASDQIAWKLSTERAITVLNMFVGYGLPQEKLSIEGYARFSPIASNLTEEGMAKNRRVEITVVKKPSGSSSTAEDTAASSQASSSSSSQETSSANSSSTGTASTASE